MKMLAKLSQTVKNGFCHLIIKLLLYCFGVVYTAVCVCVGGGESLSAGKAVKLILKKYS